jgi:hypothetical protein
MYFDELYLGTFVAFTMAFATIAAVIDKYLVDGLVNFAATVVKRTSDFAGLTDTYVVDGAVNGAANVAQDIGAAVRTPQSGRIRAYVLALMLAVTLGLAGAIIVVLSKLGF